MSKLEVYEGKKGETRFRYRASINVVFSSEGYKAEASAMKAIESTKRMRRQQPSGDTLP